MSTTLAAYEGQPAKAATVDEVRMLLQEADTVGEDAKDAFLGIDNVWQALVFLVLGYIIIEKLCTHFGWAKKKEKKLEESAEETKQMIKDEIGKMYESLNGYGTRKDGTHITLADVQKQEIRLMKECRWYLQQMARRMGVKKDDI